MTGMMIMMMMMTIIIIMMMMMMIRVLRNKVRSFEVNSAI